MSKKNKNKNKSKNDSNQKATQITLNLDNLTKDDIRKALIDSYFEGQKPADFKGRQALNFLTLNAYFLVDSK